MTKLQKLNQSIQSQVPSVDKLLRQDAVVELMEIYGRQTTTTAVRALISETRSEIKENGQKALEKLSVQNLSLLLKNWLEQYSSPSLKLVYNLTGTVLHTNLGRAPLPEEAIEAMVNVARGASNIEFDLSTGKRGDRDNHLEKLICELTGAEAATVVNNNAAAVLLVLNTLSNRKEVPVSRGELIEIGGSFRVPDIMKRAGAKLVEVGTTNRTHLRDYEDAIGSKTGLLMKVHTSNYTIQGFTNEVAGKELARLAKAHDLPLIEDLGSGTLVDLTKYGLPYEPTARETLSNGVDIVTSSGDKLLGGPQAGLIIGRKDLIAAVKKNPMKRATRVDKVTIAALSAVLQLYRDPDRLAERVPTLRLLTKAENEIRKTATSLVGPLSKALGQTFSVSIISCKSQIGSGSLPVERLNSAGLSIKPDAQRKGTPLKNLLQAFRGLPIPVIGRIQDDALILDLRCLDDVTGFEEQLIKLDL